MRKGDFAMALLEALKATEGPRGGQSMNRKDGKEPEMVFIDKILKKAGSPEEFSQRIREGKAFKLEEKAGIHIISLDTDKPPIIQITGEFGVLSGMLSFAMSELIERAAEDTGDREGIENHFRQITEAAIMASRLQKGNQNMEKMNLPLQQFLTLVGPAQTLEIIEEDASEPIFTGKAAKIRDREELLKREVKHIQPVQGPQPHPVLIIWIY